MEECELNCCERCAGELLGGTLLETVNICPVPFYCNFCGREVERDVIAECALVADNGERFLVTHRYVRSLTPLGVLHVTKFVRGDSSQLVRDGRWLFFEKRPASALHATTAGQDEKWK